MIRLYRFLMVIVVCWLCGLWRARPTLAADYACAVVAQEDSPQYFAYYLLSTDQERQSLAQTGFPGSLTLRISASLLQDHASKEMLRHLDMEFTEVSVRTVSDEKVLREWEYQCPSSYYYQKRSGKEPATFLDLGGDGLFDCLRREGIRSYVRLNDQLIEVNNDRDMPDKNRNAVQTNSALLSDLSGYGQSGYGRGMEDRPRPGVYRFIDGRWVVVQSSEEPVNRKPDPGRPDPLTFPRILLPRMPKNSEIQLPAIERWTRTEWKGTRFSTHPLDQQVINRDGRFLRLTTHFGQVIEVHLSHEGKVLDWQLDGVCQERRSYDGQGGLQARTFRVGDFCYVDADADGVFDSLHDEKHQVWFLIRLADLLKVGSPNRDSQFPVEFPDAADSQARYRLINHKWQVAKADR